MRKIWKMRRIFIPQAITLLILTISIFCAPYVSSADVPKPNSNNPTPEGTIVTTTEPDAGSSASDVKTHSMVISPEGAAKTKAEPAVTSMLDNSVHKALKKMGLSSSHIDLWAEQHPKSTLKSLGAMPPAKQAAVANVATFIRKVNKNISPKIAWREASAIVFYCQKYKVPVELAVSVAKAESRFNPSAVSRGGAVGTMQVMWKIHHGMLSAKGIATKRDHMFDPERGTEAGIMILSRYIGAYGTIQKALNRYYGGISTAYLKKVNKNMAMLESHSIKTGY